MFRTTFQNNIFSIFNGAGLDPLKTWHVHHRDGYIKRIYEPDTGILIMEMHALNTTLHYISTPKNLKQTLGIRLPILNFLIRNLNKCFSFEIKILDNDRQHRRFRCANYIRCSSVSNFETTIPLSMAGNDWVLIYFNVSEFTRRCYNTSYVETERVQINGNIHLRHVFFSDRVIEYAELPKQYQIFFNEKKKDTKHKEPPARPPSPLVKRKMDKSMESEGKRSILKSKSVYSLNVNETEMPESAKSATSVDDDADAQNEAVTEAPPDGIPNAENPTTNESPVMIAGAQPVAQELQAADGADAPAATSNEESTGVAEGAVEGGDNFPNEPAAEQY